jgi:hypothetical protein
MRVDTSNWSGEGEFTQRLLDQLQLIPQIASMRVEDAPSTRSDANYNFMSNELFVEFVVTTTVERRRRWGIVPVRHTHTSRAMTVPQLEAALRAIPHIGEADYWDEGMIQYLRTERIVPPYQTRGYKLVELVRLYEAGSPRRF